MLSSHSASTARSMPKVLPLLMRRATPMVDPEGIPQDAIIYDPRTQMSTEIVRAGESNRTGCTKATHSTPRVGKDPEGDYAADDY
jgi:hypothetical protein